MRPYHGFYGIKRYFHQMFNTDTSLLLKNNYLVISDRIKDALQSNKPIVALESTIITHGMPYPANCETALKVEKIIESEGAVPATIAFINGKIKVGLDKSEIEFIGRPRGESVKKVSRQDLSYLFARKCEIGGTTVSATMIAANAAGIPIFVTGGIGGVHRDYIETMDASADLFELARTPVAVISAGIKSILDIGRTLEYLETLGVCVASFGTNEFPSFYSIKSGFQVPFKLDSACDAANLINTHLKTGLNSGILIGVPIPDEYSLDNRKIEQAIQEALREAHEKLIKGKAVTPFLLSKLAAITQNKSLESNLALIKHNARIGAQIAKELSYLKDQTNQPEVIVFGGLNVDFTFKLKDDKTLHMKGVTQPCTFNSCLGGVARNMSEALMRSGHKSMLITSLANDILGKAVLERSQKMGFDTSKWLVIDAINETDISTGSYCSLFDSKGELLMGCGAMDAHDFVTPALIDSNKGLIKQCQVCVVDADLSVQTLEHLCELCERQQVPVWYNPTDVRKCTRIIQANSLEKLTFMSPNLKELVEIYSHLTCKTTKETSNEKVMLKFLLKYVPFIVLSRGEQSLLVAMSQKINLNDSIDFKNLKKASNFDPHVAHFPVIQLNKNERLINVSGAGDSTSAGILSGILRSKSLVESVYFGLACGKHALLTNENVSEKVSTMNKSQIDKIVQENKNSIFIEKL